jgi:hypothetical protein
MHDVSSVRGKSIRLEPQQLDALRRVAETRGVPVAVLVREAVDAWLAAQCVRLVDEDEWQRRFDALPARRQRIAAEERLTLEEVERDVLEVVREIRKARAARHH